MTRAAKFEVFKARDGWRWRLRAANGRVVATGEGHADKSKATRAAAAVKRAAAAAWLSLP